MITSDKQYKAAVAQLEMLSFSLSLPKKKNVPDVVENAARNQLKELINEIKENIDEYTQLTKSDNNQTAIEIHSLDDLLLAPIRYRLARHMSIDVFGQKVGVSPRQIARYEKEEYRNITTNILQKILKKLDVHINGLITNDVKNTKGILHKRHI